MAHSISWIHSLLLLAVTAVPSGAQEVRSGILTLGTGPSAPFGFLCLQIVDPSDGFPVRNAEVVVRNGNDIEMGTIRPDGEGFAVILFKYPRPGYYLPLKLTARARGREQWTYTVDEDEFLDRAKEVGFWVPNIPVGGAPYNWDEDPLPMINALKQRRYSRGDGIPTGIDPFKYSRTYELPVYEITIEMRRLDAHRDRSDTSASHPHIHR